MDLRCPHCQSPIELAEIPASAETTCTGCGSSFHLTHLTTTTGWAGHRTQRLGKFEVLGTVLKARDREPTGRRR
jgi:hypothetical protein